MLREKKREIWRQERQNKMLSFEFYSENYFRDNSGMLNYNQNILYLVQAVIHSALAVPHN